MERIMQIFYGNDFLPYKDKERTIHYPIVGNTFNGMNNVNELHFYVKDIGGVNNLSWVAIAKLPNGRILYELLTDIRIDHEIEENYVVFNVSQFYTQLKGEVYISLNGCRGEVEIETDQETGISTISGEIDDNTVVATGSIKLAINYAPQRPLGFSFDVDQYQNILNALANKSGVFTTIQVVATLPTDLSGYNDGQLFYCSGTYYELVETSGVKSLNVAEKNGLLGGDHALLRFVIDDDTTLEELADFGKMFVVSYNLTPTAINEFLTYVNVVGSTILLYLLDIQEMKLYSYSGVASDTFADFLDNAEETTYVERQHSANIIYGTNGSAQESALPYSVSVSGDKIVQRDSSGHVKVPTLPTDDGYDAINKAYGDFTFAKNVEMSIDENFDLVVKLKNNAGAVISQADVDLPLESIVVSAQYYDSYTYQGTTYQNVIVITLATTDVPTIIPIGDLVSGLVDETAFNSTVAQLQSDINGRVAKRTTSGSFAYGHTNANETEFGVTNNATSGTIPLRDTNGNIKVGNTPSNSGDATSKTYVDTFGRSLEFTIDNSTFVMTLKLKDNNGNVLSTQTVDLPLETMVVTGRYDDTTESLILELKNGQLITIPISDLISGLVTETSLATTLANYYTKSQIDQMVSGFVFADVDDYLSPTSENPVENKVITQELDKKANKDGNYPTMTVGVADQLSPYDEDSGDDQDEPFILQGTGTDNGTQPDFSTGAYALMREKQGNTVVVNQQVRNPNFESTSYWSAVDGTRTVNNGVCTITDNGTQTAYLTQSLSKTIPSGHKVLLMFNVVSLGETFDSVSFRLFNDYSSPQGIEYANVGFNAIIIDTNSAKTRIDIRANGTHASGNSFSIKDVYINDLTQWFNGDISADIIANPSNFFRYYQGSLSHNTGELVNANGRYVKAIKMNQWDEEWEIGGLVGGLLNSKNFIRVNPNATYYFKSPNDCGIRFYDNNLELIGGLSVVANSTFTIPSNCIYIKFYMQSAYGTTYKNDISINLYYEKSAGVPEPRCLTYEPYQVLTNNDTGTETLRSAGSVKDTKEPDGTIHRRIGIVDLGTKTYTSQSLSGDRTAFYFNIYGMNIKQPTSGILPFNSISSKFIPVAQASSSWGVNTMVQIVTTGTLPAGNIAFIVPNGIYADTDAFKTAMSGVYLFYELAEETTEQGTSYSENLVIDDFGSMSWDSDVPQGNLIFYPVDYKAFVDTMYGYTQGTPSNLALKSDLTGLVSQVDLSSGITNSAGLTITTLKAYKMGKIITLSLKANKGADIPANTSLIYSPNLAPLSPVVIPAYIGTNIARFVVNSDGNVYCESAIPNGTTIHLYCSYPVA